MQLKFLFTAVFGDVTLCISVAGANIRHMLPFLNYKSTFHPRKVGTYRSKVLILIYQTRRRHVPAGSTLHTLIPLKYLRFRNLFLKSSDTMHIYREIRDSFYVDNFFYLEIKQNFYDCLAKEQGLLSKQKCCVCSKHQTYTACQVRRKELQNVTQIPCWSLQQPFVGFSVTDSISETILY